MTGSSPRIRVGSSALNPVGSAAVGLDLPDSDLREGQETAAIADTARSKPYGAYHNVESGSTTWLEFAREIFRQAGVSVALEPITTEQYGEPTPRPMYSVLSTAKYHKTDGVGPRRWRDTSRCRRAASQTANDLAPYQNMRGPIDYLVRIS